MSRKRRSSSSEGWVGLFFTFLYIGYWWFILHKIFEGTYYYIYISIIPFLLLMYAHTLVIKIIERKREKLLLISVEKSLERYRSRV
ncbi:hypothetical protein E2R51_14285 [Jeotgalibacillus sp. S-D1]|uniref:hypothetical protein n=1 Tax=Jeotgalibacillus sp. S-D1 TaxID=2552189 RepID=UPI001059CAFB|nr:hypothetical protein [Jeotgalibacillus sp. S-D1]TDL31526.1 hypothetical protein E2R51_14285 [Jeotgalibacillus sp. S-D1]